MGSPAGPDFASGVPIGQIRDGGMLQGKAGEDDVIIARRGDQFFAVGASCTHYSGPLAKGLIVGDELRCPLHHACFMLRTGEALRAPAFDAIPCWRVEKVGGNVFMREKLPAAVGKVAAMQKTPASVVIVGGGGAGLAAADMLRREGYEEPITMISADDSAPYDRPNLSKEYLAGQAQEEWIPLRSPDYYSDRKIDLVLKSRVSAIDVNASTIDRCCEYSRVDSIPTPLYVPWRTNVYRQQSGHTVKCDYCLPGTGSSLDKTVGRYSATVQRLCRMIASKCRDTNAGLFVIVRPHEMRF